MSHARLAFGAGLALIVLGLLAAACDGGGGDGDRDSVTATPSATAPTGEPTMAPTMGPTVEPTELPPTPPPPDLSEGEVGLRFFGHSMFRVFSPDGTTILIDPNAGIGYRDLQLLPDTTVTVLTHNHFDHDKVAVGAGSIILRGLSLGDDDWVSVEETVGDVSIRSFPTFHDDEEGAFRGKNSMFLFELAGIRILHAGDLGQVLSEEQVQEVGRVDVLMIPVGGIFTLDPAGADRVIDQLKPKLVFPMHYGTDVLENVSRGEEFATLDDFLAGKTAVEEVEGNTYIVEGQLPETATVIALEYK